MNDNTMEQKIEIKVGDKVIRADGLAGKITGVFERTENKEQSIAQVTYEDGQIDGIYITYKQQGFKKFYLIGKQCLGNKLPIEFLIDKLSESYAELAEYKKKAVALQIELDKLKIKIAQLSDKDQILRKQRWRLETQMNGNYKLQNPKQED